MAADAINDKATSVVGGTSAIMPSRASCARTCPSAMCSPWS